MDVLIALITIAYFIILMVMVGGINERLDKQFIIHQRIEAILKLQSGVKFCISCHAVHGNDETVCRKCGKDKFI